MAAFSTKGGGFLVGIVYGVIVSVALYFVLCLLFPIEIKPTTMADVGPSAAKSAPVVMETVSTSAPAAPEVGGQPAAPNISVPKMIQPEAGSNDAVAVGGASAPGPALAANTQIAGSEAVSEPVVATDPASVPDIGNSMRETTAPGAETTVPTPPADVATSTPAAAPSGLAASASGPAIEVFATTFTGDTSRPMLAIVLEDTLESSLQPLVDKGVPITIAVPAGVESGAAAQSIREAGFEVVGLIPDGVSPTEGVAENVARFMQNVPVAVALMDSNTSGLMLNRASMQTVLDTTEPAGLGLISFTNKDKELIARTQAENAGVPFGSALQISNENQDEELIIQAFNQAAFVAALNGRAIIFAKARPSTINALLRWFDTVNAGNVEIVPVSVVLQKGL